MPKFKFKVDYNGHGFAGWQKQNDQLSIQGTIEEILVSLCGLEENIVGCGRTDAGVHAKDYIFHAELPRVPDSFRYKMNRMLPESIVVKDLMPCSVDFHARYQAESRSYAYRVDLVKDVFEGYRSFYYQYESALAIDKLNEVASLLLKGKEFTHFKKAHGGSNTDTCQLYQSEWKTLSETKYEFQIRGNRFLRGMVRLIVGACLNSHRGIISLEDIQRALFEDTPLPHIWSVPAKGLTFTGATYPKLP